MITPQKTVYQIIMLPYTSYQHRNLLPVKNFELFYKSTHFVTEFRLAYGLIFFG